MKESHLCLFAVLTLDARNEGNRIGSDEDITMFLLPLINDEWSLRGGKNGDWCSDEVAGYTERMTTNGWATEDQGVYRFTTLGKRLCHNIFAEVLESWGKPDLTRVIKHLLAMPKV